MKNTLLIVLLFCLSMPCFAQIKWELKKDKEGIAVYTGKVTDEKFKHIKATCNINTTTEKFVQFLQNVNHHKDWAYNTKVSNLVSRKGHDTVVYYSAVSLPWPVSDRDLVTQQTVLHDTVGKALRIDVHTVHNILPEKPNFIRVPYSQGLWTVTPLPGNRIHVEYVFSVDPGGSIPSWLVNMLATAGPFNTFKKMKSILESAK